VTHGGRGLAERVGPVDGRGDRAGIGQVPEGDQVGGALARDERGQLLAHEGGQQLRPEVAADPAEPAAAILATGDDQRALRGQSPAQVRQPPVAADVDDHVVAAPAGYRILAGVVDNVVGADRSHQIRLGRAADPGDLGAEGLGDLHGERAHASGRADDQYVLSRPQVRVVADGLQGGGRRAGHGRGLLEAQVSRLEGQAVRPGGRVLGEGALAGAEHFIARFKPGDIPADGLDRPGDGQARNPGLRPAQPEADDPHQVGLAGHQVPSAPVDIRGPDADQNLAGFDRGPGDLL
jgi:hypothetical protein